MKAEYDAFSEENLAQVRAKHQTHPQTKAKSEPHQKNRQKRREGRKGRKIEFLKVDLIPLHKLAHTHARGITWGMFCALSETWFRTGICTRHLNPFLLSAVDTKGWGLSRMQKFHALQFLVKNHFITIDRTDPKNPLVTLLWLPLQS